MAVFQLFKAICDCSGLELYTYGTESRNLQLVQTKKLSISWYKYTHESRLVLLASGIQCKSFTGFQVGGPHLTSDISVFLHSFAVSDSFNYQFSNLLMIVLLVQLRI